MFRPHTLAISLAVSLCVFAVPAGAKPERRGDDDTFGMLYGNQQRSPCDLALEMRLPCEGGARVTNSTVAPTECSCNNVFFNIWSACKIMRDDGDLPSFSAWGLGCKDASQNVTDGYANGLDFPIWAFMRVPDNGKFNPYYVQTVLRNNISTRNNLATQNWSTIQITAPFISSVATLVIVGVIVLLFRSKPAEKEPFITRLRYFFQIPYKVREVKVDDTWYIDPPAETDEPVAMDPVDIGSSPPVLPRGKARWKNPIQFPPRFRWKDRPIPVQLVPPPRGHRVDSVDHSTLQGLSRDSTEGGHRASTLMISMENHPGGSSRAHETIEEVSDEGEDTSLISPMSRRENNSFRTSNIGVGSETSTSHHVHVQPPTPTVSSHNSPVLKKHFVDKPRAPIPPAPRQPAPSPPVVPPRVPPQLQKSRSENRSQQPAASTSQLMDTHVPPISQPPMSISPPRSPGPLQNNLHYTQPRRQLSAEEDDPLQQRKHHPTRKPVGARQNLTSPSSKESLYHENAFSNVHYSAQAHQRQLSDSAARRSPLHWHDEIYQRGASPPFDYRELSIKEEVSRPAPSHHHGIAGPSSQLPRSPAPIPHRRGHSADDATSNNLGVFHPSPYSHTRNLSSENITPLPSDPVNLFPGAVRATGYPNSQAATESSTSLYSDGSYPTQPPNVAHVRYRS